MKHRRHVELYAAAVAAVATAARGTITSQRYGNNSADGQAAAAAVSRHGQTDGRSGGVWTDRQALTLNAHHMAGISSLAAAAATAARQNSTEYYKLGNFFETHAV